MSIHNFQWAAPGVVARGTQPGYVGKDKDHEFKPWDVNYLRLNKFGAVISANHCDLDEASQNRLADIGVQFHHFRTVDWAAPTPAHLVQASDIIEQMRGKNLRTLVYCGFGKGRTGTVIAAWALRSGALVPDEDPYAGHYLRNQFGVETDGQKDAIRSAVTGVALAPVAAPAGTGATNLGGVSGLPLPTSGGMGGVAMISGPAFTANMIGGAHSSAGSSGPPPFANFRSGYSDVLPPLPPLN